MASIDGEESIVRACAGQTVVLAAFVDESGARAASLSVSASHFFVPDDSGPGFSRFLADARRAAAAVVCFDTRCVPALGLPDGDERDVSLLYGGDRPLADLARQRLPGGELEEAVRRCASHLRACRIARVDLRRTPFLRLVPPGVVQERLRLEGEATRLLWEAALRDDPEGVRHLEDELGPAARALHRIELDRIRVDVAAEPPAPTQAEADFFRSLRSLERDGYVSSLFNPAGGKTGRIRHAGGFRCMGIPHGICRDAVVSRFEGGLVASLDFNAIDYRCIVGSVDDPELRRFYGNADDFHLRTAALVVGERPVDATARRVVKALTYVSVYGGSEETVAAKTGLSPANVRRALANLDARISSVHRLRDRLAAEAARDGFVRLPTGKRVDVPAGSHPGAVLGLYAQSFSSSVFNRALVRVHRLLEGKRTRLVFPVHDELVLDVHPDERWFLQRLTAEASAAFPGLRLAVKTRTGRTYREATDS